MLFFRLFIPFVLSLQAMAVVPLCYSSNIIDRHNQGGHRVRIEIGDVKDPQALSQWQVSLLLPDSFSDRNSTFCFKAPVLSADSNSIAILVTNDPGNYCYQLIILAKEQTPDFQYLSQHASKNGTLVRLKSMTADRPELTSVTTGQLLNDKPHTTPLTLLVYSDNMTGSASETSQTRNNTVTLTGGKLAGIGDLPGGGSGGFFYLSPPPPWGGGGGRPSGLFEIDLVILKPVINWLMSIGKDSISFEEQPSPARLKMTRVNADGSSSEAAVPVGWLDFLNIEQLNDVDFWSTLLQQAATSCPASESLQWQLACFKRFLERSALKTNHRSGLMAANGEGQPSGSAPNSGPKGENNDHQKQKKEEPEDQENQSPGEGHDSSGNGNNRKDDDGEESEKKATTEDLQVLANQLVEIIESQDPGAVFKFRQMLNELDMPQRLRVLETKSTNTADTVTPLEAILKLQRSFNENSLRNLFIEQLIKATSNTRLNLNNLHALSLLQPIIPPDRAMPEKGGNNLLILYKIVLNIIHKVNQSDVEPPMSQFERCCFTEYFAQLFLIYSNPVELIRNLLGKISDLSLRHVVLINPQSLTFPNCFLNTFIQFQHPSIPELERLSDELMGYAQNSHLQQVPSIEPVIANSDTISHETTVSSKDTSTIHQQADSNKRASGSSGSSPSILNDRYSQLEAEPSQPALAYQQNDASQEQLQAGPSSGDHQATRPRREKRQMVAASPAMQSNDAERSASDQQSSAHNEEANPSNEQLKTPARKERMPLCDHYHRYCRVNFECCEEYFPCHRCHNNSKKCNLTDRKAFHAKRLQCSLCNHEGDITEDSQTCPGCNELMSEYFCAQCKHFTDLEKKPFHCDKCGICRTIKDKAFHCDVCNVCMGTRFQDNHKCRENSGHDACCICLEDTFSDCNIMPCSHKVHYKCGNAMFKSGIRTCPICRHPLVAWFVEAIINRLIDLIVAQ
ncbi:CHY zinc finger protein [Endozoicomonas sp. 8E]|uniref:CHY zinc finger protein n=1 Tax=Endozoicomonas sp. 8E TaxID=3035692 RepID=UPI0029390892|nr:CHY zinc finger protein [Endozoicomonas sp. 8E]WOG27567.1 CHY zinc finger protein [Endozoicomonas sp. 8E]